MPLIAVAAVYLGAIEVSAVVAGLIYASGALYVAGKVTGNDNLLKLSQITGLAAGAAGIYEGLAGAAVEGMGAEGGSVLADSDGVAAGLADGVDAGTLATPSLGEATGNAATGEITFGGTGGAGTGAGLGDAVSGAADAGSIINPTGNGITGDAGGISQASTTGSSEIGNTDVTANNLTGDTSMQASQQTGIINQAMPSTTEQNMMNQADAMGGTAPQPITGNSFNDMPAFKPGADPGLMGTARSWWNGLSNNEKLMAGNFIAKGLGSIEDFVGPKADLTKAQAGLANSQAGLTAQQTANINQKASVIPNMTYTYTQPRR